MTCHAWTIKETFDNNADDWEAALNQDTLQWYATGGNPDGYLAKDAPTLHVMAHTTNPAFLGDYANKDITAISVDILLGSMTPQVGAKPIIIIRKSSSHSPWRYMIDDFNLNELDTWNRFTVPLDKDWTDADAIAAGWERAPGPASADATFVETMESVWQVGVRFGEGYYRIDNFTLHRAPPEMPSKQIGQEPIQKQEPIQRMQIFKSPVRIKRQ